MTDSSTATDLVDRARIYATEAHQRINHRRKYNNEPYHVHLSAVAKIVATATDAPNVIAAAWLHDTVEDTQATLEDIESSFGVPVAELVEELTDISKPGDGNRARRKAIDRQHLAQASRRAKTVKLADLIDNCKDITRHDPRFAQVYLEEMDELLDVLSEGAPVLAEPFPGTVIQGVSRVFVRGLFSQYMPYFGQHAHHTVSSLLDCFFCTVKLHQANMR